MQMCAFNEIAFRSVVIVCFMHIIYLPSIGEKETIARNEVQKKPLAMSTNIEINFKRYKKEKKK